MASGIHIQSLARADSLLSALAADAGWVSLANASRAAGLKKSTAVNLLGTLVSLGFVERDPGGGRYRLGLRSLELGRLVQARLDLAAVGHAALVRLCAETRETVNLAIPYLFESLIVESIEGTQGVRVTSYTGTRANLHSTACGKAILAASPRHFRDAFYAQGSLVLMTPRTVVDIAALETELERVRRCGYAVEREENEPGAACVGAAFYDGFGAVRGAISIAGPLGRMTEAVIAEFGELVLAETASLTRSMQS